MDEQQEKPKKRVALYLRVSTKEQVEKYGLPMQKETLLSLIKAKKDTWEFAGEEYIYIDKDISGIDKIEDRIGLKKLVEDLELSPEDNKPFDIVAVYKIDRLARSLRVLWDIVEIFTKNKTEFISAHESVDTSTPFGRAILSIIGVIAELERETIMERTSSGIYQAKKEGLISGRNAPYGYTKDPQDNKKLVKLEEQSKIVRLIFDFFVNQKMTTSEIADYLNKNNILSPDSSNVKLKKRKGEESLRKNSLTYWQRERIRIILSDDTYTGIRYFNKTKNGKKLPKNQWEISDGRAPQIIDDLTFQKAQEIAERLKHEKKNNKSGYTYLFSGLLKCDCCYDREKDWDGRRTYVGTPKPLNEEKTKFSYFYNCGRKTKSKTEKRCNSIPISEEELSNYFKGFLKKFINQPVAIYEYQKALGSSKTMIKNLEKQEIALLGTKEKQEQRINNLLNQHELGFYKRREKELVSKIDDIKRGLKELDKEIFDIRSQRQEYSINENYEKVLDVFSEEYKSKLDNIFKNRDKFYALLHTLIEDITIFSRPKKSSDKITGKKKENQMVPDRFHIRLKLPQQILYEISRKTIESSSNQESLICAKDFLGWNSKHKNKQGVRQLNLIIPCYNVYITLKNR